MCACTVLELVSKNLYGKVYWAHPREAESISKRERVTILCLVQKLGEAYPKSLHKNLAHHITFAKTAITNE